MNNIFYDSWVTEFQKTAIHLVGHFLFVDCRLPFNTAAIGECSKSVLGILTIAITPNLPIMQAYNLLLHEAAHAKIHGPSLLPSTDAQLKITDFNIDPRAAMDEDEAEPLARTWWMWAEVRATNLESKSGWETPDMSPAKKVAGRLASLMFYDG